MADIVKGFIAATVNGVTTVVRTSAAITRVGAIPGLIRVVPFAYLLLGHCLAVAGHTKGRYQNQHLLSYVQGFLMAFGGSIASNLFLGNPTNSVLFQSNQAVLLWTVAFWVVNFNPLEIVDRALDFPPVGIAARTCMQVLRSSLLVAQIDATVKAFPGIIAPAVIAGTLAASGGKITTDVISSIAGFRAPFEIAEPTYALRSSLIASVGYYVFVYVLRALKPVEGLAVVMLAFLTHTLTDDLLGAAYDYTVPVVNVFTSITLVGVPVKRGGRGRGRGTAAAVAAVAAATPAPTSTPSTPRSASKGRSASRGRKRATSD